CRAFGWNDRGGGRGLATPVRLPLAFERHGCRWSRLSQPISDEVPGHFAPDAVGLGGHVGRGGEGGTTGALYERFLDAGGFCQFTMRLYTCSAVISHDFRPW